MNSDELNVRLKKFVHTGFYSRIFVRLGGPPSVIEARQSPARRTEQLTDASTSLVAEAAANRFKKKDIQTAAKNWVEGGNGYGPMSEEVEKILRLANALDDFMPAAEFPDAKSVLDAARRCAVRLGQIDVVFGQLKKDRSEYFNAMWADALIVSDAIHALRKTPNSARFARTFQPRPSA